MERPLAILFVDIADSTTLYEREGNTKAATMTRRMLFHLRLIIEINRGGVVKTLGDGLLAAFPSADDATWAAITMLNSAVAFTLRLRVGISFGAVIQQSEDIYGDACNVAARVQSMARPGEILVTQFLVERLSPRLRGVTKFLNNVMVKGKTQSIQIHEVRPRFEEETDDGATIDATTIGAAPCRAAPTSALLLTLDYQGRKFMVNRQFPRLTIGRGEGCDLQLASRHASRHHAQIDFSRESFLLTDQSTNGTFIRAGSLATVALRRDATKLVGVGLIGFGAEPESADQDHVITYRYELG